jgi:hypothetical protein
MQESESFSQLREVAVPWTGSRRWFAHTHQVIRVKLTWYAAKDLRPGEDRFF